MAGGWVSVPNGGAGIGTGYWQCSHVGCQKKARQLEAEGHDHDCCGCLDTTLPTSGRRCRASLSR